MGRKVTSEEMEAARVYAMLNGLDVSGMEKEAYEFEDDDELEEVVEKPKKARNAKKSDKVSSKATVTGMVRPVVLVLDQYKNLDSFVIDINLLSHNIHWKEQDWGIPNRVVEYRVELVKDAGMAKNIATELNGPNCAEGEMAYNGEVRYFQIITAVDGIPARIKRLGYIQVYMEAGNRDFKVRKFIYRKACEQNNVEMKSLDLKVGQALSRIRGMR